MSNYSRAAYHPPTNTVRTAYWMDDYFGKHRYGVMFPNEERVYKPSEVEIPLGKIFEEKKDEKLSA